MAQVTASSDPAPHVSMGEAQVLVEDAQVSTGRSVLVADGSRRAFDPGRGLVSRPGNGAREDEEGPLNSGPSALLDIATNA